MKMDGDDFQQARNKKIKIARPAVETGEDESLWQEIRKFMRLIPHAPEPNLGRMMEIRDEIRKGTYNSSRVIEETAARLAIRFMTKE